ncbi:hypothetical protein DPMN_005519 [Dreissena polymorpha]|uniref:Uncharacterized protein n=1 Tax=Dreissena polymorpha TaxID=45954 RepID=A0A9D4RWN5_DREPO|nr:hypothetical protein DPMN_005519 [Dreissena polymorpha]
MHEFPIWKCTYREDWTINVAFRVLTRQMLTLLEAQRTTNKRFKLGQDVVNITILNKKNAPPPGDHVFPATGTIFELVQDLIGTNLLTKFHDDWTINMASRVLTRKNATPPWRLYIIGTNLVTKFHDDRTINVASRVLIRKNAPPPSGHFHEDRKINVASRVLTRKNAPPQGGHIFQPTGIIFELVQYIIEINLPSKFHEDWTINVASRVKNAPPPGGHVFQATETIFEVIQDIIGMNLLTKFHEDLTINVASRVLTRQMLTLHDALRTTDGGKKAITKAHHEHIVLK